jgi:hypothetical protein
MTVMLYIALVLSLDSRNRGMSWNVLPADMGARLYPLFFEKATASMSVFGLR